MGDNLLQLISNAFGYVRMIGLSDVLDIVIVAYAVYHILQFIRRTRSGQVAKALLIIFVVFGIASLLKLRVVSYIFSKAVELGLLSLVIIFQPEIRRAMERFGGNAELYERPALKFLDDTHFAALEQALAGGDVDTAVREAHTLKGVAGNLSFAALYEAASKVNAALREGDLAGATALMDPVRSAHAAVVSALSSLRDAR